MSASRRTYGQEWWEPVVVWAIVVAGIVGLWLLALFVGMLMTALTVWLSWNVFDLHQVFNARTLTTLEIFGVSLALNFILRIVNRPLIRWKNDKQDDGPRSD